MMPSMTSPSSSQVLVGRSGELSALRAALQRARDGSASVVLLSGEAGIGKTRLVEELAVWCARQGHPTA
ncbi:MAG: AAA family ATPase, partial [Actinobacteria bacterium]|nr:AAA family ATPase [Actinomycetota bacterium]